MRKFTLITLERYYDQNNDVHVTRVTEAYEIPPAPYSNGGCIIKSRTTVRANWIWKWFGIRGKRLYISESTTFAEGVTIAQIKAGQEVQSSK